MDYYTIEDLSDELLREIFRLVTVQPRPKPYPQPTSLAKLSRLSAVSTGWRTLIRGTPQLWSSLHSDDPHHLTKQALRRSKGSTLHITHIERVSDYDDDWESRWFYVSVPDPETHADVFLDLIMPQMSRWRAAFFVNVRWDALKELQRNPAPRLERLVMDTVDSPVSALNLFGGMAPLLKHIVCLGVALRWDSAIFSGLLSVNISLFNRFKVTPNNLIQLLANSPQLVSLRVCQLGRNDVRVPSGTPTIHLPHLKKIDLHLPALFAETLLRRIQAPLCEDFGVMTKPGTTTMLQITVPFFRSCIRQNLARRSGRLRMRLSMYDTTFQCWIAYDEDDDVLHHFYEVSMDEVDPAEMFEWAATKLLSSTSEKLLITLCFNVGFPFETRLRPVLKKLFRTTKVVVRSSEVLKTLCVLLAYPFDQSEPGAAVRWPLPRMRELVIYGTNHNWRYLIAMVKCRWEDGGLETPSRLKLRYTNANYQVLEELEDVIGEDQVTQGVSDSDPGSEPDSDIWEEW